MVFVEIRPFFILQNLKFNYVLMVDLMVKMDSTLSKTPGSPKISEFDNDNLNF